MGASSESESVFCCFFTDKFLPFDCFWVDGGAAFFFLLLDGKILGVLPFLIGLDVDFFIFLFLCVCF